MVSYKVDYFCVFCITCADGSSFPCFTGALAVWLFGLSFRFCFCSASFKCVISADLMDAGLFLMALCVLWVHIGLKASPEGLSGPSAATKTPPQFAVDQTGLDLRRLSLHIFPLRSFWRRFFSFQRRVTYLTVKTENQVIADCRCTHAEHAGNAVLL